MRKVLRDKLFTITINKAFDQVLQGCARKGEDTWLHDALMKGLVEAHVAGVAMSVEAWQGEKLVGGLFGMHLGHFFSGDSMFSWVPNASKAAFITFAMQAFSEGLSFIDCQVPSAHLQSLGGKTINRKYFEKLLSHGN
jgi:leucyl/phenylalanyl-tRNA--protein transferase